MITVEKLIACGVHPTQAKVYSPLLNSVFLEFKIDTVNKQAAFIAQVMHESRNFTATEESLFYSNPARISEVWPTRFPTAASASHLAKNPQKLANAVYSNRMGNGSPESGDGWKYRGRGLLQVTGKSMYGALSLELDIDCLNCPEMLATYELAARSAGWVWVLKGCNIIMANGEFDKTTKVINGGRTGEKERRALFATCMETIR